MKLPTGPVSEALSLPQRPLHIVGLRGAAPAFWVAAHRALHTKPILLLVPHAEAAHALREDLQQFSPNAHIAVLPSTHASNAAIANAQRLERAYRLTQWLHGIPLCLIVTPEAFAEALPSPTAWQNHLMLLKPGSALDREFLIELLHTYDFVETDLVAEPGQFAWRGAVVDVFSYAHPFPLRLRLEADELIRIQSFSPEHQRSEADLSEAWLLPAPDTLESPPQASLADFLPKETTLFTYEGQAFLASLHRQAPEFVEIFQTLAQQAIELGHEPALPPAATYAYPTHPQPSFPHNLALLHEHLRMLAVQELHLFAENDRQKLRLERLLEPAALPYPVHYHIGSLSAGFYDPQAQLAFYTDHQTFQRHYTPPVHRSFRRSEAIALRELYELQIGDYVVHRKYGIALFGGLVTIPHSDPPQEGVKLIFAEDAAVYVPISQLDQIGRYRSPSGAPPKLSRLGSNEWQRTTQRAQKRIRELAIDLVRLYARRRMQPGYAFGADTLQQLEFESRFPYEETPDQLQATAEVKKDMEQPIPMDRLVCGDVGFGKTEVALRAAFKAVQEGKQVALLAPTTVLVQQHLRTFQARLEGFPVRVEALSRLQSPKQQKEVLRRLANHEIDIIIGTHRLLSEDVRFADLGLVIIDEEHKFGVMAKEKLRSLYPTVDTLAMSATPIPRTLQMALSGIRAISLITTPPPNRLPVETRVRPFSWELVREALQAEIARGGQAFFVHNSIADLPRLAQKLTELLPEAQIAFVHAQMPPREVEEILLRFIYQQIDVLVTTNLIESGLDIPNANTIIVHHAHRFGLSDLHQLRGRVGRGGRQAYCYFLVPGLHQLNPNALRRLEALEEFSDLGSGFQIAMRDLEIRGAGDLFGKEQSGFIADIGYDLYQEFLAQAIAEIQEEEGLLPTQPLPVQLLRCTVECDWPARLPETWIPYPSARLEVYRRLSQATCESDLQALLRELADRFGPLPEAVLTLADILRLRWVGDKLGLLAIRVRKGRARLAFPPNTDPLELVQRLDPLRPTYPFCFIPDEKELIVELQGVSCAKDLLALLEQLHPDPHPSLP